MHRSDQFKSKLLAANIDQVIVVLATEPSFSEDLLGRALVSAEALEIRFDAEDLDRLDRVFPPPTKATPHLPQQNGLSCRTVYFYRHDPHASPCPQQAPPQPPPHPAP